MHSTIAINNQLSLQPALELEQRIGGSDPTYTAQGNYIGNFSHTVPLNRTRGKAQLTLAHQINDDMRLSISPNIGKGSVGGMTTGVNARFETKF